MRPTGQRRPSASKMSACAKVGGGGGTHPAEPAPARAAPGGDRPNLYDEVTTRIVSELEAGRAPWVRPWGKAPGTSPGLPRNAVTGQAYSGVNILMLWGALIEGGHEDQSWLTYAQAIKAGGQVRRGEKGVRLVYASRFTPAAEAQRATAAGVEPGSIAFLKAFTVFNLAQCEGLEHLARAPAAPMPERELVPRAEALIAATGADFRIGGDQAFYVPALDYVRVPPQQAFTDQINYYRTALHELSHWTGHASRLDRDQTGRFGSKPYGVEELVAELSAAFTCAALGLAPTVRHADYLGAWLAILKADNRAIFRAASKASKAADFLLAFDPERPATDPGDPKEGAETADPDGAGQGAARGGEGAGLEGAPA